MYTTVDSMLRQYLWDIFDNEMMWVPGYVPLRRPQDWQGDDDAAQALAQDAFT